MLKYSAVPLENKIAVSDYVRDYVDVPRFLECCRACHNYSSKWSCPPYDFDPLSLWGTYGAGERAQRHCQAVAEKAASLCRGLAAAGVVLDEDLVRKAALLHDLRRQEHRHAQAGARLLRRLGHFRVDVVVAAHEDPDCPPQLDEVGLLYLADKLVQEDREVGIEARFAASLVKCATEEAKQQWERRLRHAQALEALVRQRLHRL